MKTLYLVGEDNQPCFYIQCGTTKASELASRDAHLGAIGFTKSQNCSGSLGYYSFWHWHLSRLSRAERHIPLVFTLAACRPVRNWTGQSSHVSVLMGDGSEKRLRVRLQ